MTTIIENIYSHKNCILMFIIALYIVIRKKEMLNVVCDIFSPLQALGIALHVKLFNNLVFKESENEG